LAIPAVAGLLVIIMRQVTY